MLNELENLPLISANIRKSVIEAVYHAGSGHPGGSLGIVELLTALYFKEMKIDPKNPKDPNRDRFVLSKGHCSPALYGALAERGFFPKEDIKTFRKIDSYLQGHPSMRHVPGVDMSTGSLGQGVCAANGMALAAKMDKKDYRVYSILGDGELQEGQVWEAAMFAPHYKLDNLCIMIDNNGLQIDGDVDKVMRVCSIADKFRAFNWNVIEINGHDFGEIFAAFDSARAYKGKPTAIIAKTIKGKGVSFMENVAGWHGMAPNTEQYQQAIKELNAEIIKLGGVIND